MDMNLTSTSKETLSPSPNSSETRVRVLILGSGPAGLTAALYTARADLEPVVLTGMLLGGQVSSSYTVENYPGFPDGIGGAQLVDLLQKQAERFGARVEIDTATEVDFSKRPFRVKTYSTTYLSDAIIITTGATPRQLNIAGEKEFTGRGVSFCATCDGWFFKDKEVVVIGGGDSALEEGVFLTRFAKSVTIIHRRDTLRAGAVLQDQAKNNPKIKFIWNSIPIEIIGKDTVQTLRIKDVVTGKEQDIRIDGVFVFIGHTPNTELFQGQLTMDKKGYIQTDKLMRTNVAGVFAAGEVADPYFRQVITSAGMGAAAAIQANHFLDEVANEGNQETISA
jgi:thioredoxin reductase (NADPH)